MSNLIDNYERQAEKKNDFEHHKREDMVALNAKLKRYDKGEICPNVACHHNSQST